MLRGTHYLSIDSKGRMIIPSKHRDALTQLVVAPNPVPGEACLAMYPLDEWEKVERDIAAQPNSKSIRMLKRTFLGAAVDYVVDTQGRILLTPELRQFAGLDKKIVLLGQFNKFEIWDEAAWEAINALDGVDEQEEYMNTLEQLSF